MPIDLPKLRPGLRRNAHEDGGAADFSVRIEPRRDASVACRLFAGAMAKGWSHHRNG